MMAITICREEERSINPALIIIPDISGFTQFIGENQLLHAQQIIAELLEGILDADELGLNVSEIEGDAILFYKFNCELNIKVIIDQCKNMFLNFHAHLHSMNQEHNCDCNACESLQHLSLKFIIHAGKLGSVMIRDFCKLFGLDLIIAHRLLKNDITHHEYVLFTDTFIKWCNGKKIQEQMIGEKVHHGVTTYNSIGEIPYTYFDLSPLLVPSD